MIERIARALCTASDYDPDSLRVDGRQKSWTMWVPLAKAALIAMLNETSDDVWAAAADAYSGLTGVDHITASQNGGAIFMAAIRAALEEQP